MKFSITLFFILTGVILLALDRILNKERVIQFDKKLTSFTEKYRPMDKKKHFLFFLIFMTLFTGYMGYRSGPVPGFVYSWIPIILLIGILWWMIGGGFIAYRVYKKTNSKEVPAVRFTLTTAFWSPLILAVLVFVSLLKLFLYPVVYPLKGILLLKNRWFNSFSGLIGLILTIIGTVLQFL